MNKYKPALPLLPIAGFLWDGIKQMIMWRILFIMLAIINMLLNIAELIINGFNGITTNTLLSNSIAKFKSSSAGNRATINLVNPTQSIIANTDVTDINFTGPAVYTLLSGGTISNSLNVTNTSIGANTGATATTAFTFVN